MNLASTIESRIRTPRAPGPALLPFLVAGFPQRQAFGELMERVAAESDVLEIGLPFSDPLADGPVVAAASRRALADGAHLDWLLDVVCARAERLEAPVVLMSYLNPLFARGFERTARDLRQAGFDGLIVPDLPFDEGEPEGAATAMDRPGGERSACARAGLALVQLVAPTTPLGRRRALARATRGFLYAVARTGVTGGATDLERSRSYLAGLRPVASAPVCAGFGIRTAAQVRALDGLVDGVIVGSALVERLARGDDPMPFLRSLRAGAPAGGRP